MGTCSREKYKLEFTFFNINLKGELPVIGSFDAIRKCRCTAIGNDEQQDGDDFTGFRALVLVGITFFKARQRLNKTVKADFSGPLCEAEFGIRLGSRLLIAAILDTAIMRAATEVEPIYASVGLSGTTGVFLGDGGLKLAFFGFGATLGIEGRYTFDTPFCSVGIVFKNPLRPHERPVSSSS